MDTRDQYGNRIGHTTDPYGNPVHGAAGTAVDEYGNPIAAGATAAGAHRQPQVLRTTGAEHRGATRLQRSGSSSSSSSSEDDGMGGRRKKGLKEKIKEKLPGGHKTGTEHGQAQAHGTTGYGGGTTGGYGTTTTTAGTAEMHPEKKGMMEKIKEKLPGHR